LLLALVQGREHGRQRRHDLLEAGAVVAGTAAGLLDLHRDGVATRGGRGAELVGGDPGHGSSGKTAVPCSRCVRE